jgi:type II secretory pathway component GspD/PulD (secretin)
MLFVVAVAMSVPGRLHAQTAISQERPPSEKIQAKLRQRGTLILRDASLIEALFAIKENWDINIVVGNDVKGAVNGAYSNAPLHEILDSILISQGYGYLAIGDSLVIMKLEHLGAMKPMFVTETLPLEHVPPEEVVKVIEFLLSPQGKAHAVPSSKSVVVMDYPERISVIRQKIADLDRAAYKAAQEAMLKNERTTERATPASASPTVALPKLVSETFVLQFAPAEETARVIEVLLSPEGKVRAAATARAVVVTDYPERLETIRARIQELEKAAEQNVRATSDQESSSSVQRLATPDSTTASGLTRTPSAGTPPPLSGDSGSVASPASPMAIGDVFPPGVSAPRLNDTPANPLPAPRSSNSSRAGNSSLAGNADGLAVAPYEMEVAFFAPQFVKATAIVETLSTLVGPYGQVSVVAEENRIVAIDQPEYIKRLAVAVEKLDVPRRQVRIAAMIFDASLADLENIGINWNHALKSSNLTADGNPQDMFRINSITLPNPAANAVNGAITFMSLSEHFDVTAVINALRTSRDSRLLADPTVVVSDQESAKISIVTEIPYQQLTESALGGVIGTTAFREAGVTLEVTPHIARDGTVNMLVTPKFSVLTGFTEQNKQPIIAKREAQTVVRVANNQTLVIGGLRQRGKVRERSAIPYLSDIKYIGPLFRQRSDEIRESELLVFLTPTILEPGTFGTVRERAALETGHCELDQVRQPTCQRCAPPEDRTIYKNEYFGAEPVVTEPERQSSGSSGIELYRLPKPSEPAQSGTGQQSGTSTRSGEAAPQGAWRRGGTGSTWTSPVARRVETPATPPHTMSAPRAERLANETSHVASANGLQTQPPVGQQAREPIRVASVPPGSLAKSKTVSVNPQGTSQPIPPDATSIASRSTSPQGEPGQDRYSSNANSYRQPVSGPPSAATSSSAPAKLTSNRRPQPPATPRTVSLPQYFDLK